MKFKITSSTLIIIILIQIVLLDVFVITFLVKTIIKHNNSVAAAKAEVSAIALKNKESSKSYKNSSAKEGKKGLSDMEKIRDSVLREMFSKLYFDRPKPERDLKISDNPVDRAEDFIATTYDLSYESCGKYPTDPAYGVTFSGKKAQKGRTIAVDPSIIPLGSKVHIDFPGQYASLNGWYIAEDTGAKVKGNIVDIFLGVSAFQEMEKFGSRKVIVKILNQKF